MKISVVMPQLGESIPEGEVTAWLKAVGDNVERDEALVEVKTDKATVEVPAPASGILSDVMAEVGQTIAVGAKIAMIETSAEHAVTAVERPPGEARPIASPPRPEQTAQAPAPAAPPRGKEAPAPPKMPPPAPAPKARPAVPKGETSEVEEGPRLTPLARRLARELEVDISTIQGTGAGGRITREDVLKARGATSVETPPAAKPEGPAKPGKAAAPAPAAAGEDDEIVPLSPMRRRIAARMVHSKSTIPHVTTVAEVDMGAVDELRAKHKAAFEREGLKLSYMPFIMRAAIEALQAFRALNSSWGEDKLIVHKRVHLGIAVSLESGLAVPVIRNADALDLRGLARRLVEVAERARAGKLSVDEAQGSTFTITNPGRFGAMVSTPIINPPEAAILGVCRVAEMPVAREGKVVIRPMMNLCLSYDHRIVDGETAIRFLQHMRGGLEAGAVEMG